MVNKKSFAEQVKPEKQTYEEVKSEIINAGLQHINNEIGDIRVSNHRSVVDVVAQNIIANRNSEFEPVSDGQLINRLAKAIESGLNSVIHRSAKKIIANYVANESGDSLPNPEIEEGMQKIRELKSSGNVQKIASGVLDAMKAQAKKNLGRMRNESPAR